MGYRVMRKCVWCPAISEPHAVRMEGESVLQLLERRLGPRGCPAPDGDGHLWQPLHDVEEKEAHVKATQIDEFERCQCGGHFIDQTDDGDGYLTCDCCGTPYDD